MRKFFGIGGSGGASTPNQSPLHLDTTPWHSCCKNFKGETFELVESNGRQGIKCRKCGLTSWNSNDVKYKFCACCNKYHELNN